MAKKDRLSATELRQAGAAFIGVSASAEIADKPDAEVPEESVEQEVAGKGKTFPEVLRKQRTAAGWIDCSDYACAWRSKNVSGPCGEGAVACVVLCFK